MITTLIGEMDESRLILKEGLVDDENKTIASVEYCLPHCDGPAHVTGTPDDVGHFCGKHIHRAVHVTFKQGLPLFGEQGGFG